MCTSAAPSIHLTCSSPALPRPSNHRYLHQLGKYYQSVKDTFPYMFFMETPKQHFDSEDGGE